MDPKVNLNLVLGLTFFADANINQSTCGASFFLELRVKKIKNTKTGNKDLETKKKSNYLEEKNRLIMTNSCICKYGVYDITSLCHHPVCFIHRVRVCASSSHPPILNRISTDS